MALFVAVDHGSEVVAMLVRDGHRICTATDVDSAMQWFAGNLVDVLVCGPSRRGFDAAALIQQVARLQPQCERILLADDRQRNRRQVTELSNAGLLHRIISLPIEAGAFREKVEEALERRRITEDYGRLSHEVEVAERELVRIEEERRRLAQENQVLQETGGQGYRILQELVGALPWPVLGVDDDGVLALVNDAAAIAFAGRQLAIGSPLRECLPEVASQDDASEVGIDGRTYLCRWRPVRLGGTLSGRLLLLEGK